MEKRERVSFYWRDRGGGGGGGLFVMNMVI